MASIISGDIGTVLQMTVLKSDGTTPNFDDATTKSILLVKPDGTILTKTASYTSPNIFKYTTVSGNIDTAGTWQMRVNVIGPTYNYSTDYATFLVGK